MKLYDKNCITLDGRMDEPVWEELAEQAAKKVSGVITKHIIANTEDSTEKMLKLNAFDKN